MIAENQFELTRKLYEEGMKCITGFRKTVRRVVLVLAVLWLVLAVMTVRQQPGYTVIEGVVLLLVALWLIVLLPRSKAKRAYQNLEAKYGSNMARTIRFFPEEMEVEAGGTVTRIPYSDVVSVLHDRHLTVLVCQDKRGVTLKNDGYTQGDWPTVEALLKKERESHEPEND